MRGVIRALIVAGGSSLVIAGFVLPPAVRAVAEESETAASETPAPRSAGEARARAKLLHETIHGALQVMHRDFFDDEEAVAIPSGSLEDVFRVLAESHGVEIGWLNVETDVLNIEHEPKDRFEEQAAKALAAGRDEYEQAGADQYRYAGAIRLGSQCLKCHVKRRTSTEDRTAGLVIRMPVAPSG